MQRVSEDPAAIKLYTFYNRSFARLKDRFLDTLQDDFEVHCEEVDFDSGGGPCGGLDCWQIKTSRVIDAVRENMGSPILFTDIDIQFFAPIAHTVHGTLPRVDMAFQHESGDMLNIGVMGINCNQKTLVFWEQVLAEVRDSHCHDQAIVNRKLKQGRQLDWGWFNHEKIWCFDPDRQVPAAAQLHHSIYSTSEQEKLDQMDHIAAEWQRLQSPLSDSREA